MSETLVQIDNYVVERLIRKDTIADIYQAYDQTKESLVTIRILNQCNHHQRDNFVKAAESYSHLDHSNIDPVIATGEYEGCPYVVTEWLAGNTLQHYLQSNDQLTTLDALQISIQLISALEYAHNHGVVHGDLKPESIYYDPMTGVVKLSGFSSEIIDNPDAPDFVRNAATDELPRYMSPEQAMSERLTPQSDLFSFGAICYELFSGMPAFKSREHAALILEITNQTPEYSKNLPEILPVQINQLLKVLLEKNPERRPQSTSDVVEILNAAKTCFINKQVKSQSGFGWYIKWVSVCAVVMILIAAFSYSAANKLQTDMLLKATVESGKTLTAVIANDSAIDLLAQDWAALNAMVSVVQEQQKFKQLTLVDKKGMIRADTRADFVGKPFENISAATTSSLETQQNYEADGRLSLTFTSPVVFQDTVIGYLVLEQQPKFDEALLASSYLMMVILTCLVLVNLLLVFIVLKRTANRFRILNCAMIDLITGGRSLRVSGDGQGSIDSMCTAFNQLAEKIENLSNNQKVIVYTRYNAQTFSSKDSPNNAVDVAEQSSVKNGNQPRDGDDNDETIVDSIVRHSRPDATKISSIIDDSDATIIATQTTDSDDATIIATPSAQNEDKTMIQKAESPDSDVTRIDTGKS